MEMIGMPLVAPTSFKVFVDGQAQEKKDALQPAHGPHHHFT